MSYNAFLLVMSQLAGKRQARFVFEDRVIFFEAGEEKNHWTLYTKVYSGEGYLPPSVRSSVSTSGSLHFQQNGAYLKLDRETHSVYLFQNIEMPEGKYIPFRHHLSDFCSVAAEWREILEHFSESDYSLKRNL